MKQTEPQLEILNRYEFHETTVLAGISAIGEMIALKPIVENLGLDWSAQLRVIKNDYKMNQLWSNMKAVGADGKLREMICMNPYNFNDWLHELNPKSENLNVGLLQEYRKGLVLHLMMMLKISLDELQKSSSIKESFLELKKLNDEKKKLDSEILKLQEDTKTKKNEIKKIQARIDDILSKGINQLSLSYTYPAKSE